MKTSDLKSYIEFTQKMGDRAMSDEIRAAKYAQEIITLRETLVECLDRFRRRADGTEWIAINKAQRMLKDHNK